MTALRPLALRILSTMQVAVNDELNPEDALHGCAGELPFSITDFQYDLDAPEDDIAAELDSLFNKSLVEPTDSDYDFWALTEDGLYKVIGTIPAAPKVLPTTAELLVQLRSAAFRVEQVHRFQGATESQLALLSVLMFEAGKDLTDLGATPASTTFGLSKKQASRYIGLYQQNANSAPALRSDLSK